MILKKEIFCCLFTLCCVIPVWGQQHKSVIPYREVGNKMIIEMLVDGETRPFIFDTGGQTAITGELGKELGSQVRDSLVVTDINGKQAIYPRVAIASLMTADRNVHLVNVPAMLLGEPSPFECFGADGLIGSDLLQHFIVEIAGKSKTITLMTAETPSTVSLRKMLPFAVDGVMPILTLQAGLKNNFLALFDTGCPNFLSLKKNDYEVLEEQVAFQEIATGLGGSFIGIAGMTEGDTLHRVEFPVLSVGGTRFNHVGSETSAAPYSLLGVKLLNYGKVTIDYPRRRFYFEAYESQNDLKDKYHVLGLQIKDGDLIVASVWDEMKDVVTVGDRVTRINGKPVKKYDFCESIVYGVPELKEKKKTKLTIQTKNGEKVIIYEKK